LHDGFLANSAAKPVELKLNPAAFLKLSAVSKSVLHKREIEVVFHRDYSLDDGRYSNNGWLQELPDPVTKLVWDNAVLISRKQRPNCIKNSDVVEIKLGERTIRGPIWFNLGSRIIRWGWPWDMAGAERAGLCKRRDLMFIRCARRTLRTLRLARHSGPLRELPVVVHAKHWS